MHDCDKDTIFDGDEHANFFLFLLLTAMLDLSGLQVRILIHVRWPAGELIE